MTDTPHITTEHSKPVRFRKALVHAVNNAVGPEFGKTMSEWFSANRRHLVRGGDEAGLQRFNFEITNLETQCNDLAPFRQALFARYEEAAKLCQVPDFEVDRVEINATLYHDGSHFDWHDDAPGYYGDFVPSRRLTFCYYMHTDPKMFEGGELEFMDGMTVEPQNDRLVFFHPLQQHRVRRVECYSSDPMRGRWALMGWLHGEAPPGYTAGG